MSHVETPIYDQLLSEEAPPILRRGWLIPGIPYWQCWDEFVMWLPREADPTPRIRRVHINPHADAIADVIAYSDYDPATEVKRWFE